MASRTIPDNVVIFRGIENGILILLDTGFKDYEKLLKEVISRLKKNKKFFSGAKIFIDGMKRPLDEDEIGMARKLISYKCGIEVFPYRISREKEKIEIKPPLIIEKTLRAGQEMNSESDIILFGDVNPGARVFSSGSIFIYGRLRGEAYAGQPDDRKSIIVADGFSPMALSIGSLSLDLESLDESLSKNNFCYATVIGGEIKIFVVQKMKDE